MFYFVAARRWLIKTHISSRYETGFVVITKWLLFRQVCWS